MQFVYHEQSGIQNIIVDNEIYKYLFKARRHKIDDVIDFRNLEDTNLYQYQVVSVSKKEASLSLKQTEEKSVESKKSLHLIWAMVDPKTIEKQLPYLNELGVKKITFFHAEYSQKNFKLNLEKCQKILINSSQQCGRSSIIELEVLKDLNEVLSFYPSSFVLNFSQKYIDDVDSIEQIMIGCEGGFSPDEIDLFNKDKIIGLNSNLILRSETAVTVCASKILV